MLALRESVSWVIHSLEVDWFEIMVTYMEAKPRIPMAMILDLLFMFKDQTINIGSIPKAQSARQLTTDAT